MSTESVSYYPKSAKYAGADWLAENLKYVKKPEASALGLDVADVLGIVFCGIYHVREKALFHERTNWSDPRFIRLTIYRSLSSYDFAELADLVLACIQRKIRVEVSAASRGYLELTFMREAETRHPDPKEYLARILARTARGADSQTETKT